jgi:hypothetical protein
MGPTALGAMAWTPPTLAEWLAFGLTAGEILTAAIVVAVLVTLVFPPPHERTPLNPPIRPAAPLRLAPADQTPPRLHSSARQLDAPSQPIRVTGATADASSGGACGRSPKPAEASAEAMGGARPGDGRSAGDAPLAGTELEPRDPLLARRLAFARWLAQQGRLSG